MTKSEKLEELVESWINGNRSWVCEQARRMRRVLFARLYAQIVETCGAGDGEVFLRLCGKR